MLAPERRRVGSSIRKGRARDVRTAIFSTFPPRACGIGVFASDLRAALLDVPEVDDVASIAIVDEPSSPQRPDVLATVSQSVRGDYVRAARLLGRLNVDVVLLQHEYGIFGGADGEYVLSFARELSQPLVVTLHTLLSEPEPHQLKVLTALCGEAERVMVMTETARRLLVELRACDAGKIRVVPHGAPAVLGRRRDEHLAGRQPLYVAPVVGGYEHVKQRFLLSTFGLLSAGKGLETVLEAMPAIVERHPEVLYLIAGRTHPQVARREGEKYRLQLERRVIDLGLEEHVEFDDRFLSIDELADLLAATDVFVTPYKNREQIASGALTFAIAAGCAAVSTPYWYAQDVLASGAGQIVPFADPQAFADAVCHYADQPDVLAAARGEARRIGSELVWSAVAESTAAVLREAATLAPLRAPLPVVDLGLAHVRTDHLHTLVDDVGIVQHAHGVIPNRISGYCVDDVARLAVVALVLERRDGDERWTAIFYRALAFLYAATDEAGAGMRNFMDYERHWLDEPHVGDHVGRSVWALGEVLSTAWVPGVVGPVGRLLSSLVASLAGDVSLRTAAYSILGLARLDPDRLEPEARALLERFVDQLVAAYELSATDTWRWLEDDLRYDNARLPHALIIGGKTLGRDDVVELGLEVLGWLGDECGLAGDMLRLPGHEWRHRDEAGPGAGDEQPLGACALVEAELAAFSVTGDPEHGARAQMAFDWFLGRNRLDRPLYDFSTGGCSDGLGEEEINGNEGAESTLAFHRAQLVLDAAGLPVVMRRNTPRSLVAA
jgi:glycosyltransferase involved in cell wall biosynthesis